MAHSPAGLSPGFERNLLLPYVAELEVEVDRLRKELSFIENTARTVVNDLLALRQDASADRGSNFAVDFNQAVARLETAIGDARELPKQPAHDQVASIALRPLIEEVFRWQQRIARADKAELRLTLQIENIEWFPARLRHVLDGLISNSLRYRDSEKGEMRVGVDVRRTGEVYELRVSDNGVGISAERRNEMLEVFHRAGPSRAAGLGVGLAVIRLLLEQSGGALNVESSDGQGSSFKAILPRFELKDFLDSV